MAASHIPSLQLSCLLPLVNIFTCMLTMYIVQDNLIKCSKKSIQCTWLCFISLQWWVQQSQDCQRTLVHWTIEICFKAVVQDECSWTITWLNPSRVLCRYDFSYWRLMHLLYVLNVDANKITNILYLYFTPYSAFVLFYILLRILLSYGVVTFTCEGL